MRSFSRKSRRVSAVSQASFIESLESRLLFDSTAPTASADPIPNPPLGGTFQDFTVHYSDDTAVDASSIETGNILIIGPHNYTATPELLSTSGSGANVAATYRMLAPGLAPGSIDFNQPGGTWDGYDDGQYLFFIQPNSVKDTSGNAMANETLTTYAVSLDHTPPTVTVNPITAPTPGQGSLIFTITYQDDVRVRPATLDVGEVVVTGPDGYSQTADYLDPIPVPHANSITPDYEITAPNGGFVPGQYFINLHGVTDISGNPEPTGVIGTFSVAQAGPLASVDVSNPAWGATGLDFTVTYSGFNAPIDTSTLDGNDITITTPASTTLAATLVSQSTNGLDTQAIYHVDAPSGAFTPSSAGTYMIHVGAEQVADTNGIFVPSGTIGSFSVAADNTAPTAALSPITPPKALDSFIDLTVTYSDNFAINQNTVDTGNITLSGPNGFSMTGTLMSKTPSSDGTTVTAVYRVAAPNGGFTTAANGDYVVAVNSASVTDSSGNAVAAGTIGSFSVDIDTVAPAVSLAPVTSPKGGDPSLQFSVVYTDNSAIDTTTVGDNDFTITGPNNFTASAVLISMTPSPNGARVTALYQVGAPNDSFTTSTNGTYTITLNAGAVADTSGNVVPAAAVGTFTVNVDTTAPNAALITAGSPKNDDDHVDFVVTFSDNLDVNVSTLPNAVAVTGPGSFSSVAQLISTAAGTAPASGGSAIDATYRLSAPNGFFSSRDDGTYTIALRNDVVKDTAGNPIAAASLGSFAVNIQATNAPDLTGAITAIPQSVVPNRKNTVSLTISNVGNKSISRTVPVALYASPTAGFDSSTALFLGNSNASVRLAAGKSKTFNLSFASPSSISADENMHIVAILDPKNQVTEQSEMNNTLVSAGTTTFMRTFVDLATSLVKSPAQLSFKKSGRVTIRITNLGNVQASGKVQLLLDASATVAFDPATADQLQKLVTNISLHPGASKSFNLTIPARSFPVGSTEFLRETTTFLGTPADANPDNDTIFSAQPVTIE